MKTIIQQALKLKIKSKIELSHLKRQYAKRNGVSLPTNMELLRTYRKMIAQKTIKRNLSLEKSLKTRDVRSLSGVAVVSVLTKPHPCPGRCLYCPTEKGMPKSYLSNEPAAMRAILNKFQPYRQVKTRLEALEKTGHTTDKIELIVIGGTWSYLPKQYQTWFIKECFRACNGAEMLSPWRRGDNISAVQKINETAKHRIIGLTIETRPDFINEKEIKRLRMLGVTRVELGVQSLYDDVLYSNHRGHGVKDTIRATKLLRDAGFKICYHMMPGLPGSNIRKDKKMFRELFLNPDFRPDMLKIYPCVVLKQAKLYKMWQERKYEPYTDKQLANLLIEIKKDIPYYVRINRLIRDIPSPSIIAGNKISNLRQTLAQKGVKCKCIRCREVGHQAQNVADISRKNAEKFREIPRNIRVFPRLFREYYKANGGREIFLSYESPDRQTLYAFLRLRIYTHPPALPNFLPKNLGGQIRELHTYGQTVPLSHQDNNAIQHKGFGKKLMAEAEKIVKKETQSPARDKVSNVRLAVIAGVGVRQYYKKLGYHLEKTYMVKTIHNSGYIIPDT